MLARLLGDIPSTEHRRALEICAHSYVTSETLLRALMGNRKAPQLFAWLRQQPFIESTNAGLLPHDMVRETLEADLRWRDPEGFADMHRTVHQYLVERVRTAPEAQMVQATSALLLKGVNIPIRLLSWAFPVDGEAAGVTWCGTR
ncbi:hypothetical protein [Streptomyces sp. NEAU-YJ-81]|uniref:hypothetical protein n=1 Tax=Streptomyces sp. NEAU-YJ-81 TaxID=2820288 RepID=UPI001ABCFAE3|nr:hypothetical protein [Streptomyces sp. NEAU-YJ-81]MBO3682328.1 hypothetical protein [Streptomyces sp. NEAU-YJ-81]